MESLICQYQFYVATYNDIVAWWFMPSTIDWWESTKLLMNTIKGK